MVYMMQAGLRGPIKIGSVRGGLDEVERRRRELQCGCPHDLATVATAPGGPEIESLLHGYMGQYRVRGEWFDLSSIADIPLEPAVLMTWIYEAMLWTVGFESKAPIQIALLGGVDGR
jgi:hypothetical protein